MVRCQRLAILLVTSWLGFFSLAAPALAQMGYEPVGYNPPPQFDPQMTFAPDGSYCPPEFAGPQFGGYPAPYAMQPQPTETEWFSSSTKWKDLRSYEGFFFRTEYLLWDYKRPGDTLLGAPVGRLNADPRDPIDIIDPITGLTVGRGNVESLDELRLDDISGIRGTIGIPLRWGSFESSIFGFQTGHDERIRDDLGLDSSTGITTLVTTTLLDNGNEAIRPQFYDDSFVARFESQMWGAESNVFINGPYSEYFSVSPFFGFKYLSLSEILTQDGTSSQVINGVQRPTVVSEIDSDSNNQIFLPQIGLRTEFKSKYFSIAFDPKFGMGPNSYNNKVRTNNFRANIDPEVITESEATQLSTSVDLGFTGRIHLTPYFSITAGYNFVWVGNVSRPQNNIYYNSVGLLQPPGIVVRDQNTDITFQGLSIGGELRFP